MAIDTRDKRASAIEPGLFSFRIFPNPDGSLGTAANRTHMASLYSGVATVVVGSTVLGSISLSGAREAVSLSAAREAVNLSGEREAVNLNGDIN